MDGLDPQVVTTNVIKIIVLEINSTLKGIRKHPIDFLGDKRALALIDPQPY